MLHAMSTSYVCSVNGSEYYTQLFALAELCDCQTIMTLAIGCDYL